MIGKNFTLLDRVSEIVDIAYFLDFFDEIFVIDQDMKVISIKSRGIFSDQDLENLFLRAKEEYNNYGFSFLFGDYNNARFISFYFRTKSSELALIGVSCCNEFGLKEISVFRLIALVVKDIFSVVEMTVSTLDRVGDFENLLSFYKSITTPIDKELFLAYILDSIISEVNAEVGSIIVLGENCQSILSFNLGLDDKVTQEIYSYVKSIDASISSVVVLDQEEIDGVLDLEDKSIKNLISYPVKFGKDVVALVFLANKRVGINYYPFSNKDIERLSLLLDPVGIVIKNYIMFRDLFFLNQFNKKIIENIASIIVMTDDFCRIKYVNKSEFYDLVQKIVSCFDCNDLEKIFGKDVELQVNDGFYNIRIQPILSESGKVSEILWTIEDVTYRKELLNRYVMAEKVNMMSELISGIAHEIRNPISSISGFIELLKVKKKDEEFIDKFIEVISKDINRIVNLLNSFMKFSRPVHYEFSEVVLNSLISEVLDIFMYQINQKGIKVKNKVSKDAVVRGNYSLLLQVFSNIIVNSIQSINHKNGKIEICCSEYSIGDEEYIFVSVKDNGIGIPKEIQNKIFDPFFTTKPDGTGLGLSISQKIVVEHGGFIRVESDYGKGTNIMVFLPRFKAKSI
ncbi:MAG: two-component system sensor histidine kinase NtrB [Brevinematia bacterium]